MIAAQHIYTNVERDLSPDKTAGFQTLFFSKDVLSKDDVFAIEERVFYKPDDRSPIKHFFFVTPSKKWVIGRIVPVEGRDQAGRSGLYLAHSLIFSGEDLCAQGIDPMTVLRQGPFFETREEAVARGDRMTGNIDPIDVNIDTPAAPALPQDGARFTRALAQLAIHAPQLEAARKAVALVGSAGSIQAALESAFAVLPVHRMPACSFDTTFDRGGNLSFTYCWATGHEQAPHHPFFIRLNADEQTVAEAAPETEPSTAYGRWVDAMLAHKQGGSIPGIKEPAWVVCQYLDEESNEDAFTSIDDKIVASVLHANREFVETRLKSLIGDIVARPLVEKVYTRARAVLSPKDTLRATRLGFEPHVLLNVLFRLYEFASFQKPDPNGERESHAVRQTAEKHDHRPLLILALGWEKDVVDLRKILVDADDEMYELAWKMLVDTNQALPIWFLVKGKEAPFASKLGPDMELEATDTMYAAGLFSKQKTPAPFDALIPSLPQLNERQLRKLHKMTHDLDGVSQAFLDAVDGAMTEIGISPDDGFLKRWF